jgi:hypothetical protein
MSEIQKVYPQTTDQRVLFQVTDLYHPLPEELLGSSCLLPDLTLCGTILFYSRGNSEEKEFAVLEVTGIPQLMVIPVSKLRHLPGNSKAKIPFRK